jgi:hypothetical protein
MVSRGSKPNRRVEEALHHRPVTGVVDSILLGEIRRNGNGQGDDVQAAHRTAMQTAWDLQRLVARQTRIV